MKNKILLFIIVVLLLLLFLCGGKKEESKIDDENKKIMVNLHLNDDVISMDLNQYLIGVVGSEMPASFYDEALKAQVLVSKTFALNYLENNTVEINDKLQGYISDYELKEKWKDKYDYYYAKISKIVESLDGKVIKYNGNIIKSYYYALSNGKSEDVKEVFNEELPYIDIVDSSFDCNVNKFKYKISMTKINFCYLLKIECDEIEISNVIRDESNRIKSIEINNKKFSGIDLRKILSLRSTDFEIEEKNEEVEITTRGYGHGVGMSQYGANYLASINYSYEDIIKYYYKNVYIEDF